MFEVGDKVKVVDSFVYHSVSVGDIGMVIETDNPYYFVEVHNDARSILWFTDKELEAVKEFQIGDQVRIVHLNDSDNCDHVVGDVGVIIAVDDVDNTDYTITVRFHADNDVESYRFDELELQTITSDCECNVDREAVCPVCEPTTEEALESLLEWLNMIASYAYDNDLENAYDAYVGASGAYNFEDQHLEGEYTTEMVETETVATDEVEQFRETFTFSYNCNHAANDAGDGFDKNVNHEVSGQGVTLDVLRVEFDNFLRAAGFVV